MTPWLCSFLCSQTQSPDDFEHNLLSLWMFSLSVTEPNSEEVFLAHLLPDSKVRVCTFWFLFTEVTVIQNNALYFRKTKMGSSSLQRTHTRWNFLLRSHAMRELSKANVAGHRLGSLFQRCHLKQEKLSLIFQKAGLWGLFDHEVKHPSAILFGLVSSSDGFNIFIQSLKIRNSGHSKPKLTSWLNILELNLGSVTKGWSKKWEKKNLAWVLFIFSSFLKSDVVLPT